MARSREAARFQIAMWSLLAIYAGARVLQVVPGVPMLLVVALHVIPPAAFALIHGAMAYGRRGILVFTAICLAVGNGFENLGVLTGFPFGRYYFTDVMGPKILSVPLLLGLAYLGMGYISWTMGKLLAGGCRTRVVAVPLVASFIMVAWDLAMDPVWATLVHGWIWLDGGRYFGVPVTNYLGWYLTVYVFYQLFALYVRRRREKSGDWRPAVCFYAVSAAGNLFLLIPFAGPSVVTDPAGVQWRVGDITAACALVSVFVMGAFAAMAWARGTGISHE